MGLLAPLVVFVGGEVLVVVELLVDLLSVAFVDTVGEGGVAVELRVERFVGDSIAGGPKSLG